MNGYYTGSTMISCVLRIVAALHWRFTRTAWGLLLLSLATAGAAERPVVNPPFPRIGNCYGAGLNYKKWEEGRDYWAKLGLIIGGGYDVHYSWENPRWPKSLAAVEANLARLRQINPHVLVLPYVDVIEGPDNPAIPKHWWDLNAQGKRWSAWPGSLRINAKLPEVLQFNLDKVQSDILSRACFDGVFYDCWSPDPWLVPKTAQLRDGKAIVMVNAWNLPNRGFEHLNGCLAEDEFNRVIEGKVDFEEFLARYLRWCRQSRKPLVTMLVGHPRAMNMDPWHWSRMPWEQRTQERKSLEKADLRTMRFGLCTTLMGDGYFGYDTAVMGRGNWWWYPEYDVLLRYPAGPARRNPDGTWQRQFEGGLAIVNGTLYDATIALASPHRDVSTGRIGTRFTLPMFDGRILVPADGPATTEDALPRLTCQPSRTLRLVALDEGVWAAQTPGGLDLRLARDGTLEHVLWQGKKLFTGGWPVVTGANKRSYASQVSGPPEVRNTADEASLEFRGILIAGEERIEYVETCIIRADNNFILRFKFKAVTDLDLRMWRHDFAFPVCTYAGAVVRGDGKSATLPRQRAEHPIVPAARRFTLETDKLAIAIDSSVSLTLVDHRRYGAEEYLLAGYPVHGKVAAGKQWSVEFRTSIAPR